MKRPDFPAPSPAPRPRGGMPVGRVSELEPAETAAVAYLRMWFTGAAHEVSEDFATLLGPRDGAEASHAFETLCTMLAGRARPFLHHAPGCDCYGGDESAFVHLLGAAAAGDEEGAAGFALHLFTGHPPVRSLGLAARAGLALAEMARHLVQPPGPLH